MAQGDGAVQRPIDMVSEYKCVALNVDMQATVGQRAAVDPLVGRGALNEGAREQDGWGAASVGAAEPREAAGNASGPDEEARARSGGQGDEAEHSHDDGSDARSDAAGAGDCVMAYFGDHQVCVPSLPVDLNLCFRKTLFVAADLPFIIWR